MVLSPCGQHKEWCGQSLLNSCLKLVVERPSLGEDNRTLP